MNKVVRQSVGIVTVVVVSLALTTGCALFGSKAVDKVISMNELPSAVRPLAEKEIGDCRIIEVEKEMKDGKVIYAITYDQTGTKMEIEYSENGALLSKGKE